VQRTVIGLIVMMRKQPTPFTGSEQHLLEAVADYASISLANVRQFRMIKERARSLETLASGAQLAEKIDHEILQKVKDELGNPLQTALAIFAKLIKDPTARWTPDQRQTMSVLQDQLQSISRVTETIQVEEPELNPSACGVNLSSLLQTTVGRFQPLARQIGLALRCEAPVEDIEIQANSGQVSQVIAGLLSYALRSCNPGGQVALNLAKSSGQAQISVSSSGPGLNARQVVNLFEPDDPSNNSTQTPRFGGFGISLALTKEIVVFLKGKIWAESRLGYGTRIYFSIPIHL
jgi:signal transduction histidine kinase